MGEQRVFLEYGVQLAFIWRKAGDILAVKDDRALIRPFESADNPERCGFTAAAGSKQCDKCIFLYGKI